RGAEAAGGERQMKAARKALAAALLCAACGAPPPPQRRAPPPPAAPKAVEDDSASTAPATMYVYSPIGNRDPFQNVFAGRDATPNGVASVGVDGSGVVGHGTAKPDYTVFKLDQPARLVVDLASADVTKATAPASVHDRGIAGVSVAQFDEGDSRVGRVVVALDGDAKYDVAPRGND